jgi:hypothetical protein
MYLKSPSEITHVSCEARLGEDDTSVRLNDVMNEQHQGNDFSSHTHPGQHDQKDGEHGRVDDCQATE